MREWLTALPWWSLLAVQGVCLAGSAWWTRAEARRLDASAPDKIDSPAELKAADTTSGLVISTMGLAYMLLPNPWPGTICSTILSLAATGLLVMMFIPIRRRAVKMDASDGELVRGLAKDMAVTGGIFASVLLSVVAFSWAGFAGISRHLFSPYWASLLVVVGVCASYGTALFLSVAWGPWLVGGGCRDGRVADGVLFDIAETAFRLAGLPTPDVFLADGRFEGSHIIGYSGLTGGPVKPILLIEARLLSSATVREMSAALRHEASHAARNHLASTFIWKWLILAVPSACAWLAGVAAARLYSPDFAFIAALLAFQPAILTVYLYSMRLTRRQEMDADEDAVLLYGVEPQAMMDLVALLDGLNGALEKPTPWAPRTHPHLDERIAELRRRVDLSQR